MNKQQTAVEYLLINLLNKFPKEMEYLFLLDKNLIENTLNKAKEIEKKQIENAYEQGYSDSDNNIKYDDEFYKLTYDN